MNVSEQIINVIDNLCQKFGIAIDWTAENIVPYLETLCGKFIKWEIATSIFWIIFWGLISVIFYFCSRFLWKKHNEDDRCYSDYEMPAITLTIITVISIIVFISNIGCQSYDIIEAITFPEKTIYDYVTNLINTKG